MAPKKGRGKNSSSSKQVRANSSGVVAVQETFKGPLPPPQMLERYDDIIPGAGERLLGMVERQEARRQHLEKTVVGGDTKRAYIGLLAGFLIALSFLSAAVYLVINGYETAGIVVASVDIVGLAAVFVIGTLSRRSERQVKAQMIGRQRRS